MTAAKHIERFFNKNGTKLNNVQNAMEQFSERPSVDVMETLNNAFGKKAVNVVFRPMDGILIYMVGQFIIQHHVYASFNGRQSYYRVERGAFHGIM